MWIKLYFLLLCLCLPLYLLSGQRKSCSSIVQSQLSYKKPRDALTSPSDKVVQKSKRTPFKQNRRNIDFTGKSERELLDNDSLDESLSFEDFSKAILKSQYKYPSSPAKRKRKF